MSRVLFMKDFEWASATRYLHYVQQVSDLQDMDFQAVMSFRLGDTGTGEAALDSVSRLRMKKKRLLARANLNLSNLAGWVGQRKENGPGFTEYELAVLRGYYRQLMDVCETLQEHISRCDMLIETFKKSNGLFSEEEAGGSNELPF